MDSPHNSSTSRRAFIRQASTLTGMALLAQSVAAQAFADVLAAQNLNQNLKVNGHLWIYASKFPPKWDSTPVIETAFADMSAAGLDGIELMNMNLRHDDSVTTLNKLIDKYHFPVSGCSYVAPMWDATRYTDNLADATLIISRLSQVKGKTLGISVGETDHLKTEAELDAQAALLKKIITLCADHGIEPNLHNHVYEVANGLHDLKGTLARIPDMNLGPDFNWMIRGGVNAVEFINTYGKNIVYMHLRDQTADGKFTEYLGQGATDFVAIANALKAQNFKGRNVAIELAFEKNFVPTNSYQQDWKISRAYVKQTFGW